MRKPQTGPLRTQRAGLGELDPEDLAVEVDDVEIALLVEAEARNIVDRALGRCEAGAPDGELRGRQGRAEADPRDRNRPEVAVDEVAEDILAAQRLDRAAIDIAPGHRIALGQAGAMAIFRDRRHRAGDGRADEQLRSLENAPAEIGAAVGRPHQVDLLDRVLADVADPEISGERVEAPPERVA